MSNDLFFFAKKTKKKHYNDAHTLIAKNKTNWINNKKERGNLLSKKD